jgi:pimeloyl-ACP methyl ester carboxylesterase
MAMRMWAAGVAIVVGAGLLASPSAEASIRARAGATEGSIGSGAVRWADCGDGFQCGSVSVPVNYRDPDGLHLDLAVTRLPAADQAHRIGSLLTNPGGPGASGVDFVRQGGAEAIFSPAVRARYDIVGIDNRGIGRSAPVRCFDSTADQVGFWRGNPFAFPVTRAEHRDLAARTSVYTRQCVARNAQLSAVSTETAARDLDEIRAAVGDDTTTYVGASYGTYLGAVYANLFPHRVRAMVLNGVVDPVLQSSDTIASLRSAGAAAEDGLSTLARACAAAGPARCPLARPGQDGAAVRAGIDRLVRRLRAAPLPAPHADPPGTVDVRQAVDTTLLAMYDQSTYPLIAAALAQAETGDGSQLLDVARLAGVADLPTDTPYDNYGEAFHSYFCADGTFPRDQRAWPAIAARADRESPALMQRRWLYRGLACATWPAPDAHYAGPWNRRTAAPVLIVNGLHDPATAYHEARSLAALMPRSRLLTLDDVGHATFGTTSACASTAIDAYLLGGRLPRPGTVCHADHGPFDQPVAPASTRAAAARARRGSRPPRLAPAAARARRGSRPPRLTPPVHAAAATRAVRRRGGTASPVGSSSPVSSNTTIPLHSRLQPCSGWPATTRAAAWSGAYAAGQWGWCWHIAGSSARSPMHRRLRRAGLRE